MPVYLSGCLLLSSLSVSRKVHWKTHPTWSAHPTQPGTASRRPWRWERQRPPKYVEPSLVWSLWMFTSMHSFCCLGSPADLALKQAEFLTASETVSTKSFLWLRQPGEWWSSSLKFTLRWMVPPTGRRRVRLLTYRDHLCRLNTYKEAFHMGVGYFRCLYVYLSHFCIFFLNYRLGPIFVAYLHIDHGPGEPL